MVTPEELFGKWYERGEVIFCEGDPGDVMFVIQKGEVELSRIVHGKPTVLATLKRGEFFGEMCLIDNTSRSATAVSTRRTRLLPLSRRTLLDRTQQDSSALTALLGTLSLRIEEANRMVRHLVTKHEELAPVWASVVGDRELPEAGQPEVPCQSPETGAGTGEGRAADAFAGKELLFPFDPAGCPRFEEGETIFRQGDPGGTMYFVIEGMVEVVRESEGTSRRLARFGPQEFFGEMALITGRPRTGTATAVTRTTLLPVTRSEFMQKIGSKPELGLFIVQILVSRLRQVMSSAED